MLSLAAGSSLRRRQSRRRWPAMEINFIFQCEGGGKKLKYQNSPRHAVLPIAPDDISYHTQYSHAVKFHYAAKMTCPPCCKRWRLFADSIIHWGANLPFQNTHFHRHLRTVMMCCWGVSLDGSGVVNLMVQNYSCPLNTQGQPMVLIAVMTWRHSWSFCCTIIKVIKHIPSHP